MQLYQNTAIELLKSNPSAMSADERSIVSEYVGLFKPRKKDDEKDEGDDNKPSLPQPGK